MATYSYNKNMEYRREIDGLRAVAVIMVLLFHAGVTHGGYIGVDVFFLISGYLITQLILINIGKKSFSIQHFYEKRIRRILPALFVIILVYSPFAYYSMTTNQLESFGQSILAVLLFVSNILFWSSNDYFAPSSEHIPLLHTWSLAVEAQFYLIYPLFLLGMWRFAKKYLLVTIITLIIASLIFTQVMSLKYPVANFYLLSSRIWELMFGALLAYVEYSHNREHNKILSMTMPVFGLIIVISSAILFNNETNHPSIITTIPIIGAAMIIWFGGRGDACSRILSSKPFVAIGLISYSMYLWHQPILVYLRLNDFNELSDISICFYMLGTVFLSYISWTYIEQPFHNQKVVTRRFLFFFLIVTGIILLVIGLAFYQRLLIRVPLTKNITESLKQDLISMDCFYNIIASKNKKWYCKIPDDRQTPSFAIIGDSHASVVISHVERIAKEHNIYGIAVTLPACAPLINGGLPNYKECNRMNDAIFEQVKIQQIKTVLLVAKWNGYHQYTDSLIKTIQAYNAIGTKVIVMLQVPKQEKDPARIYEELMQKAVEDQEQHLRLSSIPREVHVTKQLEMVQKLSNMDKNLVTILDFTDQFCDHELCFIGTADHSFYADDNHLGTAGGKLLVDKLLLLLVP